MLIRTAWATTDPLLQKYYDEEWGIPDYTERGVFERISLETFQSGLSWLTILKRREGFREAFNNFEIAEIAAFDDTDVQRLMSNDAIVRNEKKIRAVIQNAQASLKLCENAEYAGLASLVWSYMPEISPAVSTEAELPTKSRESENLSLKLKELGFTFVGPVTMFATMAALGIVDLHILDSHRRGCSGLWNRDGTKI